MIDFRTHLASRALFDSLERRAPSPVDAAEALESFAPGAQLPTRALGEHVARWGALLDRHGVSHAVSIAGGEEEIAAAAEATELSKGRLVPFAPLDASSPGAVDDVEEILGARGFAGVVLRPAVDGYRLSDGKLDPVLEALEDANAIALVEYGLPRRRHEHAFGIAQELRAELANPLDLLTPARRREGVRFVVSHLGAGFFRELLMVGLDASNVYTETSWSRASVSVHSARVSLTDLAQRALDVFGPERLLFATGSDVPSVGWDHRELTRLREALGACGADDRDVARVLDGNARALLGLPVPDGQPSIPQTH